MKIDTNSIAYMLQYIQNVIVSVILLEQKRLLVRQNSE